MVTPSSKLGQAGATLYRAKLIDTEYVIRIDSDDIIYEVPEVVDGYDIIHSRKNQCSSMTQWLSGGKS